MNCKTLSSVFLMRFHFSVSVFLMRFHFSVSALYSLEVLSHTVLGAQLNAIRDPEQKFVQLGINALKYKVSRLKALSLCKYNTVYNYFYYIGNINLNSNLCSSFCVYIHWFLWTHIEKELTLFGQLLVLSTQDNLETQ